ncbi:MAG: FTR1 family protein, partial [Firmicutes bacterium]|nr:FTR1 family protein [Bacillota bacterium]
AQQEIIEGITALIAVIVLFYVSNWMVSKAESDAWSKYIEGQVSTSVKSGSLFTLGFTAFLAVFREGAEVILFYQPLLSDKNNIDMVWAGFGIGCVVLVLVYLAIRFLSVKLPIKPFFLGTSILMFVMSISFLGSGIKELIEGDVLTMTSPDILTALIPSNDFMEVLGIYPCLETLVPQLILLFVTLAIFVMQKLERNKTAAGVIAIIFGGLGMHKFYMGKYGKGIIYAAFCWTFIPSLIGVLEGIHCLSESDEEFKKELAV